LQKLGNSRADLGGGGKLRVVLALGACRSQRRGSRHGGPPEGVHQIGNRSLFVHVGANDAASALGCVDVDSARMITRSSRRIISSRPRNPRMLSISEDLRPMIRAASTSE